MDYDKFLAQLGTDGRSYFLFETFILKLIGHDLGKPIFTQYRSRRPHAPIFFDAVAEDGYAGLPGPTAIELKFSPQGRRPFTSLLDSFVRIYDSAQSAGMKGLLFILAGDKLPAQKKKDLISLGEPAGLSICVWDDSNIQELIETHKARAEELLSNLAIISLSAFPESQKAATQRLSENISRLHQAYEDNELTLVLGAGVSRGAGMADWNALLDALLVALINQKLSTDRAISKDDLEFISKQYRNVEGGNGPLLFARYIRKGMQQSLVAQPEFFLKAVTDTLYNSRDKQKGDTSGLLQELARMCIPRRGGSCIRGVITYNFDDLLEKHLEQNGTEYRPIFHEGETASKNELPIYHVHGFLPRDRDKYTGIDKSLLVFSEEGYHKLFSDPYHWSNLIQLHHMIDSTCLMVGLSLTDPNIRRLLEISTNHHETPRHYALLRKISFEQFVKQVEPTNSTASYSKESIEKFLVMHHSIQEDLLKELGVNVIWFDNFEDMPQIVRKIITPLKQQHAAKRVR